MTPFDRHRALWEAVLFEGLPDGRAAYMLKLHHATSDGLGIVDLLSNLHSRTRESNPDKPQPLPPVPEHRTPAQELAHQIARDARALPAAVAHGAASGLRVLARPGPSARGALRFGELAAARARRRRRGGIAAAARPQHVLALQRVRRRVRRPARRRRRRPAARSTTRSSRRCWARFRRYHEELGQPIERMPIAVPISVRSRATPPGATASSRPGWRRPVGDRRSGRAHPGDRRADALRPRRARARRDRHGRARAVAAARPADLPARGRPDEGQRPAGLQRSRHPRGRLHRRREDRSRLPVRAAARAARR